MGTWRHGSQLPTAVQQNVLGKFVYRFTKDNIPQWAEDTYPVQFESDDDWLNNTKFYVKKDGHLDERFSYCRSRPTWPDNPELRKEEIYAHKGEVVTCDEHNHPVFEFTYDVYVGEVKTKYFWKEFPGQKKLNFGDTDCVCHCGGRFIRGSVYHFKEGWRSSSYYCSTCAKEGTPDCLDKDHMWKLMTGECKIFQPNSTNKCRLTDNGDLK